MNKRAISFFISAISWAAVFSANADNGLKNGKPRSGDPVITLERAYDMTLATDQSIRIAAYEIRKANLLTWSALTRLGPSVTANGSFNASRSSDTYASGIRSSTTDASSRNANITFSQPLLDLSVFPAYDLGKLTAKATGLQYKFTVRQTLFGVAQAYYNVLSAQSVARINKETVDLAQAQLVLAQSRLSAGTVARIDVARAVASLEDARKTLIQSQGTLDTARDTLSNILNLGGKTNFVLAEPAPAADDGTDFEKALSRAYSSREDYQVAEIAIGQDIDRRKEVMAEYAPRIVAQASSGWTSVSAHTQSGSQVSDGVVSIQVPFLTGGQREIDLRTASHQIAETRLNYDKTAKSIESEVKNAWLRIRTDRESIKALQAEVDAATQNYTDLQNEYQAGTTTSLDVQVALISLNNSRTSLSETMYDKQIALRDLARSEADFQKSRVQNAKVSYPR